MRLQVTATIFAVFAIFGIVFYYLNTRQRTDIKKANVDIENTRWLSDRGLKKEGGVVVASLDSLGDCADGIPIYAKMQGKRSIIAISKPIHTLVLGATGSGKTQTFVSPCIEILSRTRTKPSMVITDPKGELYLKHAHGLTKQGYEIKVLNLTDVYYSVRWNPFGTVIAMTKSLRGNIEFRHGKYYIFDKQCQTYREALGMMDVTRREIEDKIRLELSDGIKTAFPVTSTGEGKSWEEGAQGFILGVALCMWEDLLNGVMEAKQFNLFNLFQIVSRYAKVAGEDELDDIKHYFDGRNEFYGAKAAANAVLSSTRNTLTSYLSTVHSCLRWLSDRGIQALTSDSELDLLEFDEQAYCLFVKIPDAQKERHNLVSLLVLQMYKSLVEKAGTNLRRGETKAEELKRATYFILDEFGNMPKFESLDSIITVGRSRRVYMVPIIQDFRQIDNKYGKEVAGIVRNNCTTQIYIQSVDQDTNEQFSKMVGKKMIRRLSSSATMNQNENLNYSVEERPLITANELRNLNDSGAGRLGTSIVLIQGKAPIKASYTPLFKAQLQYDIVEQELVNGNARGFDESSIYFDICKRDDIVQSLAKDRIDADKHKKKIQESEAIEDAYCEITEADKLDMYNALIDEGNTEYSRRLEVLVAMIKGFERVLTSEQREILDASGIGEIDRVLADIIKVATKSKNHILLFASVKAKTYYDKYLWEYSMSMAR